MSNYRVIEITDGCMGGESEIYITDAPDDVIESALKAYASDDSINPIEMIEKDYEMDLVINTMLNFNYCQKREILNVSKSFEIY